MAGSHKPVLRAADVMSKKPVCTSPAATVQEIARLFDANDISGLPVVDGQNRLLGVVSKTDLIHRCLEGPIGAREGTEFWDQLRLGTKPTSPFNPDDLGVAEDFMSIDPVTAAPHELLSTIARRMAEERVHRVVVVDEENHPLGVITTLDILKVFPE